MSLRTFIAVDASLEVRSAAVKLINRMGVTGAATGVKWVAPENLHWTLQFLGDVDERDIPEVCQAVAAAAAECAAFDIEVRGAGAFPSADRPRTLWLGAGQGSREMTVLHAAVERRLRKRGYRGEERRFVPHITLGRAGRKGQPQSLASELAELRDYDAGSMLVDEVTVYSSQLGPDGPAYDVLARAPLAE
ncbi:MAG TPA: RNA 2',3'-cyclic phosphodiesterase [Lacipirellulaceae bacterium]